MTEMKFKVENDVGFDDEGLIEASLFVGNDDNPVIDEKFSMREMVEEFLDIRSINGKLAEAHKQQAKILMDTFEKSMKMIQDALKQ